MQAYNDYVVVIREETGTEKGGMIIPSAGRKKPHVGIIHSVGSKVADHHLRKAEGTKCLFHQGVGQEIEFEGVKYLILHGHEVIGRP